MPFGWVKSVNLFQDCICVFNGYSVALDFLVSLLKNKEGKTDLGYHIFVNIKEIRSVALSW